MTFCKTGGGTHTIPQKKGNKKGKNSVSENFFRARLHEAFKIAQSLFLNKKILNKNVPSSCNSVNSMLKHGGKLHMLGLQCAQFLLYFFMGDSQLIKLLRQRCNLQILCINELVR